MRKTVVSILGLLSFAVQAQELSSFSAVANSVNKGGKLTFVLDFNECKSDKPLGPITSSVTPNAVMVIGTSRITASDRHFTLDNPSAVGMPTFSFVKYNINSDGSSSVKITTMNAITYEKLATHQVECQLGDGFKVFD